MTVTLEGEAGFFGTSSPTEVPVTNDLPPCPTWMTELAKAHTRLQAEERVGPGFWWFLSTRVEQVLARADDRGMIDELGKIYDADWRDKGRGDAAVGFKWNVRNIGSEDGIVPPSQFSIAWDLIQVVLLAYVLTSVPFSLAFDVSFQPWTFGWLWESFVDLYFVLDILLNFRTPYYSHGVLIDNDKEMALHYFKSWGAPDILSCASLIGYFTPDAPETAVTVRSACVLCVVVVRWSRALTVLRRSVVCLVLLWRCIRHTPARMYLLTQTATQPLTLFPAVASNCLDSNCLDFHRSEGALPLRK